MTQDERTACASSHQRRLELAHRRRSTAAARRSAYGLLLSRGLIRLTFPAPAEATRHFDILESATDPYGVGTVRTSLFIAGRSATNFVLREGVMSRSSRNLNHCDAGSFTPDITKAPLSQNSSKRQAINATLGHAEAVMPGLSADQVAAIVNFELALFSSQTQLTAPAICRAMARCRSVSCLFRSRR